ncbi:MULTISPECIES: hypothetical protein [unclassified Arcicella]|uniref:hypothetical protein n=1 Tax=unclassified Arcicella TaxID=2644986 RepID=UPI0028571D4B|nr:MULTISPECIES: hypothetical protein [unclassified Arcicella]MDR6560550.1 hypothetical protein [Arcicella sp. BE51]MDR6809844.1 hypothetical protein [Arcicella sp. BE140]MDR6821193.1 hypothetical protein [Arcicella sp. BE139]
MKKFLFYSSIMLLLSSCILKDSPPELPTSNDGYLPIYLSKDEIEDISITTPQPLISAGKIYIKDQYLFVNEVGKGVHIFDNKDPKNPQKIAFLKIPGNVDIAISGNILYADNARDLVSINISKPTEPKVIDRQKDVFESQNYPSVSNTRFECVDNTKGTVIGWQKVSMNHYALNCYR